MRRAWSPFEETAILAGVREHGMRRPALIAQHALLCRNGRTGDDVASKIARVRDQVQSPFATAVIRADATFVARRATRLGVGVHSPPAAVPAGLEHVMVAGAAARGSNGGWRAPVAWTAVELDSIIQGVRLHGTTHPSAILANDADIFVLNGRTALDIKHKIAKTVRDGDPTLKSRLAAAVTYHAARYQSRGVRF